MIVILNYYQNTIFSNLVAPSFYKIPFRNRKELAGKLGLCLKEWNNYSEAISAHEVFMTDLKRSKPYCAYECTELYAALEKNPMRVRDNDRQVLEDIA